jgi:hypothetical protein
MGAAPSRHRGRCPNPPPLGWDPGVVTTIESAAPDGDLEWRLTESRLEAGVAVLPFLIHGGKSRHASGGLEMGVELRALTIGTPNVEQVSSTLELLGGDVTVEWRVIPYVRASLATQQGNVTLEELAAGLAADNVHASSGEDGG